MVSGTWELEQKNDTNRCAGQGVEEVVWFTSNPPPKGLP